MGTKAGVMMRESLAAGSRNALATVTIANGLTFQRRTSTDDYSTFTTGPSGAAPQWVRLTRVGSTISSYTSSDGSTSTLIDTDSCGAGHRRGPRAPLD